MTTRETGTPPLTPLDRLIALVLPPRSYCRRYFGAPV
jgi:hypothetical protein